METLAREIGFSLTGDYNASRLLWDNLDTNSERRAILSDSGDFTYGQLAVEAAKVGNVLLQAGCKLRERSLDRKSVREGKSVELGGRRTRKKKKKQHTSTSSN